jgi:uncharacterized protein YfiM (DUF2279 family)
MVNMSPAYNPFASAPRKFAPLIWGGLLLVWLLVVVLVPDPRPFGAPELAVRLVRSAAGVSEPTARAAATIVLRGVGVGLIGVLLALSLQRLRMRSAASLTLVGTPLLAIGAKWINFGYFPITPQLVFIVVVSLLGALSGLVLRRSWIALTGLLVLAVGLLALGTSTRITDDLYERARMTGLHLLENAEEVSKGDDRFALLLAVAFAYAEDNSHGTDAVLSNQAAILALGVILGEDRVAWVGRREIDPDRQAERKTLRSSVRLHHRGDLSQHFWVSAALTVLSGKQRALTVGIAKEMKDSTPGGSGFSFVDMAANKAGIRFASAATRNAQSARNLQLLIARGVTADYFFPDISGLPEGISQDTFRSEYGGLGGAETRRLFEEIDRRLDSCKGLQ